MHYIIDGTFEGRIFTKSLNTGEGSDIFPKLFAISREGFIK